MNTMTLKKGDFLYCSTATSRWVCIVEKINNQEVHYYISYNLKTNALLRSDWFRYEYVKRPASICEVNLLLCALDREGFSWDYENDKLVEKEDKLLIPDCIGLFRFSLDEKEYYKYGDGIFLGNVVGRHLLGVTTDGYINIDNHQNLFNRIKCRLLPCNYNDLKAGDTAFRGGNFADLSDLDNYCKILNNGYVYKHAGNIIKSYDINYQWYKIIPV